MANKKVIVIHEGKICEYVDGKFRNYTPEEYVRQHFTNWLINYLHYPMGLIANEVKISLNSTIKRCDTIVYSNNLIHNHVFIHRQHWYQLKRQYHFAIL